MGFWHPRTIKISGDPVTSSMDVISVGSLFAHRRLMAVEGKVLIGKQSELDCQELCVSTCKITKVFLVDFHNAFSMPKLLALE
jgi:hypothetical protein